MTARLAHERLQHGLRVTLQPIGEFIHVSAIYLGLAVLTTLGLSLTLPSMREQSRQLHEVVLAMFQENGGGYAASDDVDTLDWSMPAELPRVPDAASPSQAAGEPSGAPSSVPAPTVDGGVLAEGSAPPASGAPTPAKPGTRAAAAGHSGAGGGSAGTRAEGTNSAVHDAQGDTLSFSRALAASLHDQAIPGITTSQAHALRSYLARKYKIASSVSGALVRTAFIVGRDLDVDPQLLLAVIAIESRYNPFAESAVGAQGLMQVMTRVHRDKLDGSGGQAAVFNPVVNIRVGAQILSDCIRRRGSVQGGLACYVGATGPGDGGYGASVLAERRRIALASGIPPDKG